MTVPVSLIRTTSLVRSWLSVVLPVMMLGGLTVHANAVEVPAYSDVKPLMERYCFECHGGDNVEGDVDYSAFHSNADYLSDPDLLDIMEFLVADNEMPPPTIVSSPSPPSSRLSPASPVSVSA